MPESIYIPVAGAGYHICITVRDKDGNIIHQNGELPAGATSQIAILAPKIFNQLAQKYNGEMTQFAIKHRIDGGGNKTTYAKTDDKTVFAYKQLQLSQNNVFSFNEIEDAEDDKTKIFEWVNKDTEQVAELVLPKLRVSEGHSRRAEPSDQYSTYSPGLTSKGTRVSNFPSPYMKPPSLSTSSASTKRQSPSKEPTQATRTAATPAAPTDSIEISLSAASASSSVAQTQPLDESAPPLTKLHQKAIDEFIRKLDLKDPIDVPNWSQVDARKAYLEELKRKAIEAILPSNELKPVIPIEAFRSYLKIQLEGYVNKKFTDEVPQETRRAVLTELNAILEENQQLH